MANSRVKRGPGCDKRNIEVYISDGRYWRVRCNDCYVQTGIDPTKENVIKIWNNRPGGG